MTIVMMAFVCGTFTACGGDDDDSSTIPSGLIGTWYKVSGSYKYSMEFTFKSDGTGTGFVKHNSIISMSTFAFKYSYKSNGQVECSGVRVMADENGEDEASTKLTFQYADNKLTLTSAPNSSWEGAGFNKSGIADDDDYDEGEEEAPLNVNVSELFGTWNLAGFGKSPGNLSGSNPGEYMEITSSYRIVWGGQQNGQTAYYSFSYSNNTLYLTLTSGKGSNTEFEITSFSKGEMVLYQRSSGYYRKWTK